VTVEARVGLKRMVQGGLWTTSRGRVNCKLVCWHFPLFLFPFPHVIDFQALDKIKVMLELGSWK
jgi:hypothetical protein